MVKEELIKEFVVTFQEMLPNDLVGRTITLPTDTEKSLPCTGSSKRQIECYTTSDECINSIVYEQGMYLVP